MKQSNIRRHPLPYNGLFSKRENKKCAERVFASVRDVNDFARNRLMLNLGIVPARLRVNRSACAGVARVG